MEPAASAPDVTSTKLVEIDLAAAEIGTWRQGDLFDLGKYPVLLRAGTAAAETAGAMASGLAPETLTIATRKTSGHVVAISQTCDLVRPPEKRADMLVAPVLTLAGDELREARAGTRPRYAHLPRFGMDAFADLDHVFPVEKAALLGRRGTLRAPTSAEVRDLATAIARHFGRFAFPDDFVAAVAPLTNRLRSKYGKESEEGEVLRTHVEEILVEADWMTDPYHPTIIVVLAHDVIAYGDDLPEPTTAGAMGGDTITDVCKRLMAPDATPEDRSFLWLRLGELWAELCGSSPGVGDITIESIPESELPYSRARRCSPLDLDYLSVA